MRISDWSSDVCSSDLFRCGKRYISTICFAMPPWGQSRRQCFREGGCNEDNMMSTCFGFPDSAAADQSDPAGRARAPNTIRKQSANGDRKSGVQGTRVSVRVDLGGRRDIKKKKT